MGSDRLPAPAPDITEEDWRNTPASVKRFILVLVQRVAQLEGKVRVLAEKNQLLREQLENHMFQP